MTKRVILRLFFLWLTAPGFLSAIPPAGEDSGWIRTRNLAVSEPGPESSALENSELAWEAGDSRLRLRLLEKALGEGFLIDIVRVELAEMIATTQPERAIELLIPLMRSSRTKELKEGALEIIEAISRNHPAAIRSSDLQKKIRGQSRSFRRRLEIVTARAETPHGRKKLLAAIKRRSTDLPALDAARKLQGVAGPTEIERWYKAKVYYRHALYDEASPAFEELSEVSIHGVPAWEGAYYRGRCAFRKADYPQARHWYLKALQKASTAESKATIHVHIARCLELEGDLENAASHARRAVSTRATDSRRLFLARLRLRTGRPDLAALGISRLRSSSRRSRGKLLIGLFSLSEGHSNDALAELRKVDRNPWKGPAGILRAKIFLDRAEYPQALKTLRAVAPSLDLFWSWRAKEVMKNIPEEMSNAWRKDLRTASRRKDALGIRALREWSALEFRDDVLEEIREHVALLRPSTGRPSRPGGIAGELFKKGLRRLALRWDPRSLPSSDAKQSLWSASIAQGVPWLSIRMGDAAWRKLGDDLPPDVYAPSLLKALFPLPEFFPKNLQAEGPLLAAIAREESRWKPDSLSSVGARGLVQLMPATARGAAFRENLPEPSPEDLFDPGLNLRLGASEITELLEKFDGYVPAAVAAYNAGSDQASLWLDECGTNCPVEQYILWIGFKATRGYTADVLSARTRYRKQGGWLTVTPHQDDPP